MLELAQFSEYMSSQTCYLFDTVTSTVGTGFMVDGEH